MSGEVIGSLVNKVVDLVCGIAKREISYMWYYNENVERFNKEVEKLKVMRGNVQQQIDIAEHIGDNLKHGVKRWVEEANDEISKAVVFLEQERNAKKTCFNIGMCGNWDTLHRYGKGATKTTPSLLQLQERGSSYESGVSVYTPALGPLDVYQNKDLEGIHTHNIALNAIITALEDDNIQIVGIYGLGGVGKTTLAKEVVARVKNKMFANVAFTVVSQNVDVQKIKKDTAEAAKRIVKGDKILIILDDVWETLILEELCIPCGSNYKNCKILLTSRSQDVCQKMNAQSKICVNALRIKEAWILFKNVVGEKVETDANLKQVAIKVVEECGGLPLLIKAVGNALKEKNINSWNLALTQLKKQAPAEIDRDIEKAFTHLKLSYEFLTSQEAKLCFLLCSMFPEDDDIFLEDLAYYGVGLGKFVDLDSIQDARDRVQNAVDTLTSSSLLLKTKSKRYTKMHDVVRDVALLIASEDHNKLLVKARKGLKEWLPRSKDLENYMGISLSYNQISKLPDYEVHLPNLQIFNITVNWGLSIISDEFIRGMKEVKVLDMNCCYNAHLPKSLKLLTKLRMLDLRKVKSFHEISILGEMKDLEILILDGTGIKEIPKEIGELVKLRRLEVIGCKHLSHITPCVISKLQRLEELCIDLTRVREGLCNSILEIMKLSRLTYLKLHVQSFDVIPDGISSEKLKGFYIRIGEQKKDSYYNCTRERNLEIYMVKLEIPLLKWLKNLIEVSCPFIFLNGVHNLHNIMPDLYQAGFNKLEKIYLDHCSNLSCLVDSTICDSDQGKTSEKLFVHLKHLNLHYLLNLEVLGKCPDEYISFTNLVTLTIYKCVKLESVFTVSLAQSLVNLKDLTIKMCKSLQEVVRGGEDDHSVKIIVFPSLANINMVFSSKLKSFYSGNGNCTIKYPSLVEVILRDCGSMQIWGPGIHETFNLKEMISNDEVIVLDGPFAINEAVTKFFGNRKRGKIV